MPERRFEANALEEQNLQFLADFFKVLGDPTRMKILFLLFEGEMCVGELAGRLKITQSAVSHQLSLLKSNRLVRQHRDGKSVFYTLADGHVYSVIAQGWEHILEYLSLFPG